MKLNEAGVTLIDCDHKTPAAQTSGYPYIGIPQLKNGHIRLDGARLISEEDFVLWTKKAKPKHNDVILSRRCNPGESAYVPEGLEIALGQNLVLLRSDGSVIYPPFLRWLVQGNEWWEQVNKFLNVGAVFDSLKCKDIPNFNLTIPSLKEQKRITDILSSLDNKIELNNKVNQTLESITQAIFKSWFIDFDPVRAKIAAKQNGEDPELAAMCAISGKSQEELQQMPEEDLTELRATVALFPDELVESELGEVPKGWEILDIDKTTSLIIDHRGKTPKKLGSDWSDTGITVLSAKHIKDGYIVNREQLRFVDTELYNKWMKEELEEGDILLTSEGPMGEMYYLASDEKYCLSQRLYALRANTDLISSAFLYFWLLSPYAKSDMNGRATGTTVVGIRQSELRKVKVLTPPKNICDLFNEKVKANLKQIALNNNKSVDLAHIRDILLPKLMAGDLTLSVGLLDE
ncbi:MULTISPECIES: restriction endonuclease subunit S [Acinetobacter]|uniref:restriction endonuclease subunit S n=1 Tax=Acinetobacter TaxID=469 RepID=UPI0007084723|nr:restriction endonuclease subunit S [Acinetobacter baumannii]ELB2464094.1 restriction endonuclease subunit S [Acinetobacter baumannii]KQH02632.1 type I restriction endonuclease subunit S [Acinetobacter baumannii]QSQ94626.1 restriction endonuclease subunit S [Acinetobacter indicus]TPT55289.1 restriction endonuclease subunit S [Acinetobacter baumannii]